MKLTVQGEVVAGTILQQSFIVEYVINHQMCDDCRRVEAKDTWNANVSVKFLSYNGNHPIKSAETHVLTFNLFLIFIIIILGTTTSKDRPKENLIFC